MSSNLQIKNLQIETIVPATGTTIWSTHTGDTRINFRFMRL